MNKTYFVCSDIHSYYTLWMQALDNAGFDKNNENHIIILCGDLLDRGDEPKETLNFVCQLIDKNRIICICGNHEFELQHCILRNGFNTLTKTIGTRTTAILLNDLSDYNLDNEVMLRMKENTKWKKYYDNLINYYETSNYIFVHGWIPCYANKDKYNATQYKYNPNWRESNKAQWYNASWYNGIEASNQGVNEKKTIVCGHINDKTTTIYKNNNLINIDATVYKSKKINILVLNDNNI